MSHAKVIPIGRTPRDAIPRDVDMRLADIAVSCTRKYPRGAPRGWTRFEYVDAMHRRLRDRYLRERGGA